MKQIALTLLVAAFAIQIFAQTETVSIKMVDI